MTPKPGKKRTEAQGLQQRLPLTWEEAAGTEEDGPEPPAEASEADAEILPSRPSAEDEADVLPDEAMLEHFDEDMPDEEAESAGAGIGETDAVGEEDEAEPEPDAGDLPEEPLQPERDVSPSPTKPAKSPGGATVVRLSGIGDSLGTALLEARAAADLTVSQVAERTKVPKRFIEDMELERYDQAPPPVYSKAHIRKLCEEYGIDPEPALAAFREAYRKNHGEYTTDRFRVATKQSESGSKVTYVMESPESLGGGNRGINLPRLIVTGLILLFTGIAAVAITMQHFRTRPPEPAPADGTGTPAATVAAPPVPLTDFIQAQQLTLKELPIPDK